MPETFRPSQTLKASVCPKWQVPTLHQLSNIFEEISLVGVQPREGNGAESTVEMLLVKRILIYEQKAKDGEINRCFLG